MKRVKRPSRESLCEYFETKELPDQNNIDEIRQFVTDFMMRKYDFFDEDCINQGRCFIWAYLVWALSVPGVRFVSHCNHVCVQSGNEFCDSRFISPNKRFVLRCEHFRIKMYHWGVAKMVAYWCKFGIHSGEFFELVRKLSGVKAGDLYGNMSLVTEY